MDSAAEDSSAIPEAGVTCTGCEYDLRGLSGEGLCPECGTGIAESVLRAALARSGAVVPLGMAPRWWVRRLGVGCVLVLSVVPAQIIETGIPLSVVKSYGAQLVALWDVAYYMPVVTAVVASAGAWLIGTTEPGGTGAVWQRRMLRASAVLIPPVYLGTQIALRKGWGTNPRLMGLPWIVATGVVTWAGMRLLADVVGRAGRRVLARWCSSLAWGLPALTLLRLNWFIHMEVFPNISWTILPGEMVGDFTAAVLLPIRLYAGPPWNGRLAFWSVTGAASVAAVIVVMLVARILWREASNQVAKKR